MRRAIIRSSPRYILFNVPPRTLSSHILTSLHLEAEMLSMCASIAQSVNDSLRGRRSGDRNSVAGDIHHISPDRPCSPPRLLNNGYHASSRRDRVSHSPLSKAEVKEIEELQVYFSSGPSKVNLTFNL